MKTKIGEKTNKPKVHGLKGFLKAYPGAAVLAGLVVAGGLGVGAMTMIGGEDEIVLENDKAVVEESAENTENKVPEEKEEVVAKSTEEVVEEIMAAGANNATFSASDNGMKVDIVVSEEMSSEEIETLDAVV